MAAFTFWSFSQIRKYCEVATTFRKFAEGPQRMSGKFAGHG
jgi:hypothetical protein